MMKHIENKEFLGFYDRNSGRVFSDLEFRNCRFISSAVSITRNPRKRSILRNLCFFNCEVIGSAIRSAILEDVIIEELRTGPSQVFHIWGAVFKHVVFRGNIGRIMISPFIAPGIAKPREQRAFDKANANYYSKIDWALDISEGKFMECEIQGVPSGLVRRDPATQFVIRREKALEGKWRQVNLSNTYWPTAIELFLESGNPDYIMVAPKRDPSFSRLLAGLVRLRDAGIVEPD